MSLRSMARPRLLLLALALALATLVAGCGEDVNFTAGALDGAPPPEASTTVDGARARALGDAASDTGELRCPAGGDAATCQSNGQGCRDATSCCSGRCEGGYCLPPGTCSPPGAPCNDRNSCCSGRCEPGARGSLSCSQFCQANGAPCDDPDDCCSLACNGGQCGGPICKTASENCSGDVECCSGKCAMGRCAIMTNSCLPTAEACAGDAGPDCCSSVCDEMTGRCDLGPGNCREPSSPCTSDSDCCLGTCSRGSQSGLPGSVPTCTAACLFQGQDCNSNGDCCAGVCGGAPSRCGPSCP